ncbi:MAG: hypothetical protein JSS07_00835 [Proteobacteria bacterium]|nr:hypothetical protein [Pseudomonadota bacterium]
MRLLLKRDLNSISGGSLCEDALIRDIQDFDFNPNQFCTKPEFTKYVLALVDKFYELNHWGDLTDQMEIDLIKSLHL